MDDPELAGPFWRGSRWFSRRPFFVAHLRQVLTLYASYYYESHTHLSLHSDAPLGRAVHALGRPSAIRWRVRHARVHVRIILYLSRGQDRLAKSAAFSFGRSPTGGDQ